MAHPAPQKKHEPKMIESTDPATLEKIGEVRAWTPEEIARGVRKAREAQPHWGALTPRERGRCLLKARDWLVDHIDDVTEIISRENGKPRTEALVSDVFPVIYLIDYFAKKAAEFLADEPIESPVLKLLMRRSYIHRTPRGVVAVVAPWNFPFSIPAGEVCMALMAGNAVILKPARATCLIGEKIGELYAAAGLPEGTFQVVHGSGQALLEQKLDFIAFTGSVEVGKQVMAQAARTLTPVMLELGGKDPMIVCRDANLDVASSGAVWGAFLNAGQVCASIERVYVDESVSGPFVEMVVDKTRRLRQGRGMDPDVDVGPMTTQEQFDIVVGQMDRARKQGAKILAGGEPNPAAGPGRFYKPTVLVDVGQDWECVQEETFGPTMPILTFKTEDEAVRLSNDNKFGLTASVWTKDLKRGERLARRIEAGTVTVNDAVLTHAFAETPWGGPKNTGVGRTHGKYGLLDFTDIRHVHLNRSHMLKNPWMFPYSPQGYQAFKSTAMLLRTGIPGKIAGARDGLRLVPELYRRLL